LGVAAEDNKMLPLFSENEAPDVKLMSPPLSFAELPPTISTDPPLAIEVVPEESPPCKNSDPPRPLLDPAEIVTLPPVEVASRVAPAEMLTPPPFPVLPRPTSRFSSPLGPPSLGPVRSKILPDDPSIEAPVFTSKSPLLPVAEPLICREAPVVMRTEPLESLLAVVSSISPLQWLSLFPLAIKMDPPVLAPLLDPVLLPA